MISEEKINRINYLAKKSKEVGLSESEILEQKELRKEYVMKFKNNLKGQLENIKSNKI